MAHIKAKSPRRKFSPQKRSRITITVITIVLVIFGTAGLLTSVAWLYFKINPTAGPETHVTTYASTILDEKGEERYFMELEYWENQDGNGKQVYEFCFNAYSGVDCTTVIQKVAQFWNSSNASNENINLWSAKYYDRDGAASWKSIDKVDNSTEQYFKIGEELFSISMNGTYSTYTYDLNIGKGILSIFKAMGGDSSIYFGKNDNFYDTNEHINNYTMNDFYLEMLKALTVNNVGYGANICNLVDLAKFFTLKHYNGTEFVDIEENQEYAKEYFAVKVTKHADGLRRASDSNAGIFNDNPGWTLVPTDNLVSDFTDFTLGTCIDNDDFDFYYCQNRGGYIANFKDDCFDKYQNAEYLYVKLDELGFTQPIKIIGVVKDSLYGLDIEKFIVQKTQKVPTEYFYLFVDSNSGNNDGLELTDLIFIARDNSTINVRAVEIENEFFMGAYNA